MPYNAERTLAETIACALDQDVEQEVIVVNDGSTDGSAKIIREFGDRIRSLSTPNRGVSSARESGTKLAGGRYIQYLDSDDLLAPATLSARLEAVTIGDADVVHTEWQKMELGRDGNYVLADVIRPDLAALERDAEAAIATSGFWAPQAALLYQREIIDRIGNWPAGCLSSRMRATCLRLPVTRRDSPTSPASGPITGFRRIACRGEISCGSSRIVPANASEIETIWWEQGGSRAVAGRRSGADVGACRAGCLAERPR